MAIKPRIGKAQNDETRLGRVFPVEENPNAQATLKRPTLHDGGIKSQMRLLCPHSEGFEPGQGLEVNLAIIFAPCPT